MGERIGGADNCQQKVDATHSDVEIYNNGSHKDQIFANLSAHCFALWAKNRIRLRAWVRGWGAWVGWVGGRGADAPNMLCMKWVGLSFPTAPSSRFTLF